LPQGGFAELTVRSPTPRRLITSILLNTLMTMTTLNYATPRCNPEATGRWLRPFGLQRFDAGDIHAIGELAHQGLPGRLADGQTVTAVHALCGGGLYLFPEADRVTGALAIVPLCEAGLARLMADDFDSLSPDLSLVARPGEALGCVYAWGIVGRTRRAKAAVLSGLAQLQAGLGVPFFCRAASEDGARVIGGRLAYAPLAGSTSGLFIHRPAALRRAA
jgi:hypothetical protein